MATNKIYEITNWNQHFEKAQTRKSAAKHTWVAVPNRHDGLGFKKLMREENGLEIFGVWVLLVQIASKAAIRGILADDDGEPYAYDELALLVGRSAKEFEQAIGVLVSIKWVSQSIGSAVVDHYQHTTSGLPVVYQRGGSAVATTIHNITEQTEQTKQNKTAKNRPQAVDPSFSSSQSSSQPEENASKKYIDDRKFRTNADAVKIWDSLPRKRRGTKRNFIAAILQLGDDHGIPLAEKFAAYYASEKGTGECPKGAGTLIEDEFWLDDPSDWGSSKKKKFTESAIDHAEIITRFVALEKTNTKKVEAERARGSTEGMIAFKICKKHPELAPKNC